MQLVHGLDLMLRTLGSQYAGEERELSHRESAEGQETVFGEIAGHPFEVGVAKPGDRHMRRKLARLAGQTDPCQRRFHTIPQLHQLLIPGHTNPEDFRLSSRWEMPYSLQRELKRFGGHLSQGINDILEHAAVNFADEFQREVKLVGSKPACAGHTTPDRKKSLLNLRR